jgi:hypothetical protein
LARRSRTPAPETSVGPALHIHDVVAGKMLAL